MLKMKELPKNERPRERLIKNGVEQLNNEELLAILLQSGNAKNTVKELSCNLLKEIGGIAGFQEITYENLLKIKGIGNAKACLLLASIELGKRISRRELQNTKITNAEMVYEYYKKRLEDKKQEYFYCIYLDHRKRMLKEKLLFIGTINQSLVHPREIFKEAYLMSASSIICIHNHPSNQLFPSKADYELTKRLIQIGTLLGIPLNDHVIIGKDGYYSFYENHDLE